MRGEYDGNGIGELSGAFAWPLRVVALVALLALLVLGLSACGLLVAPVCVQNGAGSGITCR